MAYCSNCGAYIPDGETSCVACGTPVHVFNASQAGQTFQQAQQKADSAKEDLYDTLKQNQQKQKEQTEKWAAQAGTGTGGHSTSQNTGGSTTASKPYSGEKKLNCSKSKVLAFFSYWNLLCFLPFFFAKDDEFAVFHGKQGIVLFVFYLLSGIVKNIFPFLRWILNVALWAFTIYGFFNVFSGYKKELPFIGKYASKFKF